MHWQQKRCCKRGVQDLHGLTMKMRDLEAYLERTWLLGHWHVFFTLQLPVTSVSTMFSTYDYILIVQIVLKTIYIDSIYMHIHSIFIYSMYNIVQYIYIHIYIALYFYLHIHTFYTCLYVCVSYLFIDDSLSCVICRASLNLFCPSIGTMAFPIPFLQLQAGIHTSSAKKNPFNQSPRSLFHGDKQMTPKLGGGNSNIFYFQPLFGEDFTFDLYFSDGLKPATSKTWWCLPLASVFSRSILLGKILILTHVCDKGVFFMGI